MTTACVAIIIVVFISTFMCIRNGYRRLGYSILPISLVPAGHIVGTRLVNIMRAGKLLKETAAAMSIVTAFDVAACVIGAILVIFMSDGLFKRKSTKRVYFTTVSAFLAILTIVLLVNYYNGF